ncbi:MAG: hypothetical protein QHH10_04055 [Peptococcaceae bacterium]|jgi:hypothetical protein|nr:hypothetical protein [Peptococcaceae bacterium]MDH7524469.1 hypothetical protein [Peptococcaceae bacterium]
MYKKWLLSSFILLVILLALLPGVANARLSVSSPEGTLKRADLIVTGTVIERNYEDERRKVTIEINEVLKGTIEEKQLKLERKKNDVYGWTGFDFPEPGAKIFLLLGGDKTHGYWPAGDLNFLAVVADGHVSELYKGSKIGINDQSWPQEDYAKAYDAFYQSHRQDKADLEQTGKMTKEQIATLIQTQGKHNKDSYIEGLSFELANLDDDAAWEIVAKIDGAVHLGQFFIFDQDLSGAYKLIAEEDWKVEQWDFNNPIEIEDKRIFKLVTRTGGTGLDVFTGHLWYLKQGKFIEAWQGTVKERSMMAGPETFYMKVGGYQVDVEGKRLYQWETTHQLDQDGVSPKGDLKTSTKVYLFNGTAFIQEESQKADPAQAIIVEEEREVIPNVLVVTKTVSDYAHGQHIIWVEGRFKHTAGELYLTLLDEKGQQMQSGGIHKSDEVKPIDDEWSFFSHKLIEDTGKVVDTDKATIIFHLQKEGKNQKGLLYVPAKNPVGIFTKDTGKSQDISNKDINSDHKNWEVVSRTRRVEGTILKLDMTSDELKTVVLKVTKNIQLPNDPVDSYYRAGQIIEIVFDEKLASAGSIRDRLKQGAQIVVTFAQYAVPPDGKVVLGASLGEGTYYVENGKYYDIEGKEVAPAQ